MLPIRYSIPGNSRNALGILRSRQYPVHKNDTAQLQIQQAFRSCNRWFLAPRIPSRELGRKRWRRLKKPERNSDSSPEWQGNLAFFLKPALLASPVSGIVAMAAVPGRRPVSARIGTRRPVAGAPNPAWSNRIVV